MISKYIFIVDVVSSRDEEAFVKYNQAFVIFRFNKYVDSKMCFLLE